MATTNSTASSSAVIEVINRATYDDRKNKNLIKNDVVYFVVENVTDANRYLSLYVGLDKQTDVVSLNTLTGYTTAQTIEALQQLVGVGTTSPSTITTTDKIYYWEDVDLDVFRAYLRSTRANTLLPVYSNPIWETIETETETETNTT